MDVKMTNGGQASKDDIASLEAFIGKPLPQNFLAFVSEYDGAQPSTNIFRIDNQQDSGVNQFIPVSKILTERERIENLNSNSFPVAWAEGGNYVLIDMKCHAEVQFWDHETAGVSTLAASFADFLAMLQPFRVEDVELRPGQVRNAWIDPEFQKDLNDE